MALFPLRNEGRTDAITTPFRTYLSRDIAMTIFHAYDGFTFQTTRKGRIIRCVCQRDGRESSCIVKSSDPESIHLEQVEAVARSAWSAGERRRHSRRDETISDKQP